MSLYIHVLKVVLICITITVMSSSSADGKKTFLELTEEPVDQTFLINSMSEVIFSCTVNGSPKPMITWKRNGYTLDEDDQFHINDGGELIIQEPNKTNHGEMFMCIVSNSVGKIISRNATLEIAYIDAFLNPTRRTDVNLPVERLLGKCLPCGPPDARPGIRAIWSKIGTNLQIDEHRTSIMRDGRLCFAFTEYTDSSNYQCSVANSFDKGGELAVSYIRSPNSVNLAVTENIEGNPSQSLSPVSGIQPRVTVKRGQIALMNCFFFGNPAPTITWRRVESEIPTKAIYTAKMIIPDAQPADSGEYRCMGSSGDDSQEIIFTLIVTSPPILTTELEPYMTVNNSNSVSFLCETNDTDGTYDWFYNAEQIIPTRHLQLKDTNILFIKRARVTDSGIYQCRVTNRHGSTLSTARLQVNHITPESVETAKTEKPKQGASADVSDSPGTKLHASMLLLMSVTLTSVAVHQLG